MQSAIVAALFGVTLTEPVLDDPPMIEVVQEALKPAEPAPELPPDAPAPVASISPPDPQPVAQPPVSEPSPVADPPPVRQPPDEPVEIANTPLSDPEPKSDPLPDANATPKLIPVDEPAPQVPLPPPRAHPAVVKSIHVMKPVPRSTVSITSPAPARPATLPAVEDAAASRAARSAEETLRGRIHQAVQDAVQCPAAARVMRQFGKAAVAFNYRDGALAGDVQVIRSTGIPMLDTAAMAAVRGAAYPAPPPEVVDHLLRLMVWVEEDCGG